MSPAVDLCRPSIADKQQKPAQMGSCLASDGRPITLQAHIWPQPPGYLAELYRLRCGCLRLLVEHSNSFALGILARFVTLLRHLYGSACTTLCASLAHAMCKQAAAHLVRYICPFAFEPLTPQEARIRWDMENLLLGNQVEAGASGRLHADLFAITNHLAARAWRRCRHGVRRIQIAIKRNHRGRHVSVNAMPRAAPASVMTHTSTAMDA